jgi:cytochrome c-type biogenesis protein CcmE
MERTSSFIPGHAEPVPEDSILSAHRVKVFLSLTVLVVALGYLGFMAFESATVYFYTVSELKGLGPTEEGRIVRVSGKLVPDSFARDADSTLARFSLVDTEGSETLLAIHQGVVPDLFFNDHSEIILEGSYMPDGSFESRNVIVKCPSKYIASS